MKDHLDKPVSRVPVRVVEQQVFTADGTVMGLSCPETSQSRSDGRASFFCNTPRVGVRAALKVCVCGMGGGTHYIYITLLVSLLLTV